MRYRAILSALICCFIGLQAVSPSRAAADSVKQILILPFTIYSDKDLSFLQKGIQDMLSTRLVQEGVVRPVPRERVDALMADAGTLDQAGALRMAAGAGADYVVLGSVTVLGDQISTDARVFDAATRKIALTFNDTGNSQGEVISHVNRFAEQVNSRVFGSGAETARALPPAPQAPTDPSRKHPETLWTGRVASERASYGEEGGYYQGEVWRSRNLNMEIIGLALGDVDGDGQTEMVFVDESEVHLYRLVQERFVRLGAFESRRIAKIVAVDVADIDGNGRAEIFVTAVNRDNQFPISFVLEWTDGGLKPIVTEVSSYFRVIHVPGGGAMLVGQGKGGKKPFISGVEEMTWNGGTYAPAAPQALPSWINVFAFSYGDVTGNGNTDTMAFTDLYYLRLLDSEGQKEWESPEEFGGSGVYLKYPADAARIGEYIEEDKYYLPQRILIADVDGDGVNEVIVSRNRDAAKGLFERLRLFKGGHIECLSWDKMGLYPEWRTREISGHLSDYSIGDVDNDGRQELVYTVIRQIGSLITDSRSFVAVQDLVSRQQE